MQESRHRSFHLQTRLESRFWTRVFQGAIKKEPLTLILFTLSFLFAIFHIGIIVQDVGHSGKIEGFDGTSRRLLRIWLRIRRRTVLWRAGTYLTLFPLARLAFTLLPGLTNSDDSILLNYLDAFGRPLRSRYVRDLDLRTSNLIDLFIGLTNCWPPRGRNSLSEMMNTWSGSVSPRMPVRGRSEERTIDEGMKIMRT